ncbi:RCC1 domain-containing protein [Hyalangium versicolor]|uniref:RCC1 domain-containing protein n=1 Tax=Hyalangium versicolor TaxID=2861190 RepID=UPI001CCE0B2B|nr:RCC1 repeat-containing protein [Hyalangium versicolor]
MAMTALVLGLSARAEPPPDPELLAQGSREERQQRAARHVLVTTPTMSMATGEGGSIWVWGGAGGQLMGTLPEFELASPTPVRMPGMKGAVSLSRGLSGTHSLALLEDGTVEAWGLNGSGQLGDGSTASRDQRVKVQGLTNVSGIAAGTAHSLAVLKDGTVWAWGSNFQGQLGDGTKSSRVVPTPVLPLTNVVAVAAGSVYSLALRADGTVWAWGFNNVGQLGDGTRDSRLTPVPVPGLTEVVAIEAREDTSYAVRADGTVWAWGNNFQGQLGDGSTSSYRVTPAQVPGLSGVVSLSAGRTFALALRRDGSVWAWGNNTSGQIGNGTQSARELPQQVPGLYGVVAVAAGSEHSLVLRKNGSLWTWGLNMYGAMGTGSDRRTSPVPVAGLRDVQALDVGVYQALAVDQDGSVWSWGLSHDHSHSMQAAPQRVQGLTQAVAVASGNLHSLAVRQDGTVWAWGDNAQGQLGDGTVGGLRTTPAPVQDLQDVVAVAAGENFSLALKQDGTVWAWGANYLGQLGDGTQEDRSLPVQVQGLQGVSAIRTWGSLVVALKQDGTVWFWGNDWWAQDGVTHLPDQVRDLSDVVSVSPYGDELRAVRSDGTVWQWVPQQPGEPGLLLPVDGLTDAVAVHYSPSTYQILRADGTVWSMGDNNRGELGYPTREAHSTELKRVPGLTGVVALSGSGPSVHALRADGRVMSWGDNTFGTIGDGVSPLHLEPTKVRTPCRLLGLASGEDAHELRRCHAEP